MKKVLFAAVLGVLGTAAAAQAGGCDSPYCQKGGRGFFGGFGQPIPAFQAAPWYLYWPYNQHFMTPSPMQGPYSAPPMGYGGLVNPYFPAGGGPAGGYSYPQQAPTPMPQYAPPAGVPQAAPGSIPQAAPAPLPRVSVPVVPAPGVIRAGR